MKIRNTSKGFILFVIMWYMMCGVCYASDSIDATTSVAKSSPAISSAVINANKVAGVTILTYDAGTGTIVFNNREYSDLDVSTKKEFMEVALGTISKSDLGPTSKNKVYNFIANQDESVSSAIRYLKNNTDADFVEARKWFEPFSNPISTLMGFMCICIFAFLGLSIVFDICYLVIPFIQLILERGEDNKKPWGVSTEAWGVRREVEQSTTYKGTMQLYVKRRTPVFIIVAIILSWLISGKIYDIIIYFMDAFNF